MQKPLGNGSGKGIKRPSRTAVTMLILLVVVTVAVFVAYRFFMQFEYFRIVLAAYMIIAAALVLTYVIYNRGMSRRGVTADMLPESWSEEEKAEFIADSERRFKRSRWLLIPIFAFFFTFAMDIIELFVVPFFSNMFGGL